MKKTQRRKRRKNEEIIMGKIQINILSHHKVREPFFNFVYYYLVKIKDENKNLIKIVFHTSYDSPFYTNMSKLLNDNGIESSIMNFGPNYMVKVKNCIESDYEYSCSMDDDILINNYLWDYMIENIDILKDEKNIFLAPLISNGIPGTDYFINDFMNEEEKLTMNNLFKNTNIPSMWGANYSMLNNHTINAREWYPDNFYDEVSRINHFYKGIHPIRISLESHMKMAEIVMKNFDKIDQKSNYELMFVKRPYFCNSFYFIKTQTWKNIIHDKSLICDGFDEVPLNMYKDRNNQDMVFVKNGFCIHMAYNTIGQGQGIVQNYYMSELKKIKIFDGE